MPVNMVDSIQQGLLKEEDGKIFPEIIYRGGNIPGLEPRSVV